MIIDTTYLLPLARIRINNDLLRAFAVEAIWVILKAFKIEEFHRPRIIELRMN